MTTLSPSAVIHPFPGLRSFTAEETHLFFGREGQSDALIRKLDQFRFLAVVGSSGSGKSSLVRAGLLPALEGGYLGRAGSRWRIADLRPRSDPIGNLSAALRSAGLEEGVDRAALWSSSLGVVEAARCARQSQRLGEGENLLILVDQFEELFRFQARESATEDRDEKAGFVKLLLEAAREKELPLYVVITMRSDFLGDCARFRDLPEAINAGQYLIPRMTREQRRAAIESPVHVAGAAIAERLVQRLLNEVGENPDQLPVLQHALMRTWNHWQDQNRPEHPVDIEDYEAIGTIEDALSRDADEATDEVCRALFGRGEFVVKRLFQSLREHDKNNRDIRRPRPLSALCEETGASREEMVTAVECFRKAGRTFLTPLPGEPLEDHTDIDITHESLLWLWRTLAQDWVKEEEESRTCYLRLVDRAELEQFGSPDYLRGPLLQSTLEWWKRRQPHDGWASRYHPGFEKAKKFLFASQEQHEAEQLQQELDRQRDETRRIEEARREQEAIAGKNQLESEIRARKAENRLKRMAYVLAAAALAAAVAAGAGLWQAKQQTDLAVVRLLASKAAVAAGESESLLQTSVLLAAEAMRRQPSVESQVVLSRGLSILPTHVMAPRHPGAREAAFSPDGRFLATGGEDAVLRLWDIAAGRPPQELKQEGAITAISFSQDGRFLVSGSAAGHVGVWETDTGKGLAMLTCSRPVETLAISPTGGFVVADCGELCMWRASPDWASPSRHKITISGIAQQPKSLGMALSPDGRQLAVQDNDGKLHIQELSTGKPVAQWSVSSDRASRSGLAFHPGDPATIAQADADGNVTFWSYAHGNGEAILSLKHASKVNDLAFSHDGRILVTGCENGVAKAWRTADGREIARMIQDHAVHSVGFADSSQRVSAVAGGEVRLWQLPGLEDAKDLGQPLIRAAFSSDGAYFLGRSLLGARLWDLRQNTLIGQWSKLRSYPVAISPDHQLVAVRMRGLAQSALNVWRLSNNQLVERPLWPTGVTKYVSKPVFSPDGKYLGGFEGATGLYVWNVQTGKEERRWEKVRNTRAFSFTPDSRSVAVAVGTHVQLFDVTSGKDSDLPIRHSLPIVALAFSPNGRYVVTADTSEQQTVEEEDEDPREILEKSRPRNPATVPGNPLDRDDTGRGSGPARLWLFPTGERVATFEHPGRVAHLAFSPDSRYLLTSSSDRAARVWDLAANQEVARIGNSSKVHALAFTGDSRIAVADNTHLATHLWRPEELLHEACNRITRNLTPSEWKGYVGPDIPYRKTCPSLP